MIKFLCYEKNQLLAKIIKLNRIIYKAVSAKTKVKDEKKNYFVDHSA